MADAGGELLMEVEWRDAPAKGVSIVGQRQTLSLAQWNEQYKARKNVIGFFVRLYLNRFGRV